MTLYAQNLVASAVALFVILAGLSLVDFLSGKGD